MDIKSNYHFPIFISSTVYNLIDLRAELAQYLSSLGYNPILSSAEGFPDYTPELEPWESCLRVLDTCFIMILIIDGKYGSKLEWPNFKEDLKNRILSPTHAEYIYAHMRFKRILIFIRSNIIQHYANYRNAMKSCNNDESKVREILKHTLPDYVDFDTLKFTNEVKTTKPIPWIKEFEDVTQIKKEIQRKMMNELSEIYMLKDKHLETVIIKFSELMNELPEDKRTQKLKEIGITSELIEKIEENQNTINDLKIEKEQLTNEMNSKDIIEQERDKLAKDKNNLERKIKWLESQNISTIVNTPNLSGTLTPFSATDVSGMSLLPPIPYSQVCDKCGQTGSLGLLGIASGQSILGRCSICNRHLCNSCWPGPLSLDSNFIDTGSCPDCSQNY